MSLTNLRTRRRAQSVARSGVVVATIMLAITAMGLLPAGVPDAGAAEAAGFAQIVTPCDGSATGCKPLANGGSATGFSLLLPGGAACTGDTAGEGYTYSSFMLKDGVDVATLTFDPLQGPMPNGSGADFRQPLYTAGDGAFYVGNSTAAATTAGGPGPVVNIPAFDFVSTGLVAGDLPAGTYLLGVACLEPGTPGPDKIDRYWTAKMTVSADGAQPAPSVTWVSVAQTGGGTTTTAGAGGGSTTTTAAGGSTTSTTRAGGSTTSTTRAGGSTTSTTIAGGSTTSTTAAGGAVTTTTRSSGTTGGGVSGAGGGLAATGSSPWGFAFWAAVLLICGRLAIVLGQPPKVSQR